MLALFTPAESGAILISSAQELSDIQRLAERDGRVELLQGRYVLTADIDLPPGWIPIGCAGHPFAGEFDGRGYIIRGLDMGLFGYVQDAKISNVIIQDAQIKLEDENAPAGILAAVAVDSIIENVAIKGGSISGGGEVGGIVGLFQGSGRIADSKSSAVVEGTTAGGIAGKAHGHELKTNAKHKLEIVRTMAYGNVQGQTAGGLVGEGIDLLAEASAAYGDVHGIMAGGFVGRLTGNSRVIHSYARGDVFLAKNPGFIGGFVGEVSGGACIEFSFSAGSAVADICCDNKTAVGGFAGAICAKGQPTTVTHCLSFAPWVVGPTDAYVHRFAGIALDGGVNGCFALLGSVVVQGGVVAHVLPSAFSNDGADMSNAQVEDTIGRLGLRNFSL